jgi:hypothetical protein
MYYLADRLVLVELPPPARPFADSIFCEAAAGCSVVHNAATEDELGSDTFDPAEFEPALEEDTDIRGLPSSPKGKTRKLGDPEWPRSAAPQVSFTSGWRLRLTGVG